MKTRISFIGDISLNNRYSSLYETNTNPFEAIANEFSDSDLVVGNLECLAKGDMGESQLKFPRLKTELSTLNLLKKLRLGLVSLAHNHVYDNLEDGFIKTVSFLNENEIQHIGAATSKDEASTSVHMSVGAKRFTFLNYVTADTNPNLPKEAEVHLNWFDKNRIISDISKVKENSDFVVLLLHWSGDTEHFFYPNLNKPKLAKEFIANGADLIIGHHTHTFQPYEIINGKHVLYSLGNFCFDDIVTETKVFEINRTRESDSFIIHVDFEDQDYQVQLVPIKNNQCQIEYNHGFERKFDKRMKKFELMKKLPILWNVEFWFFKKFYIVTNYLFGNGRGAYSQLKKITFKKVFKYLLG